MALKRFGGNSDPLGSCRSAGLEGPPLSPGAGVGGDRASPVHQPDLQRRSESAVWVWRPLHCVPYAVLSTASSFPQEITEITFLLHQARSP